jgi:hypothetical protein
MFSSLAEVANSKGETRKEQQLFGRLPIPKGLDPDYNLMLLFGSNKSFFSI